MLRQTFKNKFMLLVITLYLFSSIAAYGDHGVILEAGGEAWDLVSQSQDKTDFIRSIKEKKEFKTVYWSCYWQIKKGRVPFSCFHLKSPVAIVIQKDLGVVYSKKDLEQLCLESLIQEKSLHHLREALRGMGPESPICAEEVKNKIKEIEYLAKRTF